MPLLRTLDELLHALLEEARLRRSSHAALAPVRAWPARSALVYQLAGREDLAGWIRRAAR